MKWTLAIFIFASFVPCAACDQKGPGTGPGSASESASGSKGKNPCSLLTKEEVGQVTGVTVAEPTRDGSNCNYVAPDATNGSAMVSTTWEKTEADAKADYGATAGAMAIGGQAAPGMPSDGTGAITGLGDEASYGMYFLHVRKGNVLLQVSVNLPNRLLELMKQGQAGPPKYSAAVLEMDKTLAAKALARL
jgi:hypothetical protein